MRGRTTQLPYDCHDVPTPGPRVSRRMVVRVLTELAVRNLGVVAELRLELGPAMTALTGETGAGKTLIIDAIGLLLGEKSDPAQVRPGADAAIVEGRWLVDGEEIVVRRIVPAQGRTRCYINGDLATLAMMADVGRRVVEIHGQHSQQSLLSPKRQRAALDHFAGVDTAAYDAAGVALRALTDELATLGGDDRARTRELGLLVHQVEEIAAGELDDPDEDRLLAEREELLGDAAAHREVAFSAGAAIDQDDGLSDQLRRLVSNLESHVAFAEPASRLVDVLGELDDVARTLRSTGESIDDDPGTLEQLQRRRQELSELRRKYGDRIEDVMAYAEACHATIEELRMRERRALSIESDIDAARAAHAAAGAVLRSERTAAAPQLADEIETHLVPLGMAGATVGFEITGDAGEQVELLLAPNSGLAPGPLRNIASGGELSRVMLALHLSLSAGTPTMIFDEVDAGIGGATADAVGRALAALGERHQVLVVTHLPQVAAWATSQVSVRKIDDGLTTSTSTIDLTTDDPITDARISELARMLSGDPLNTAALDHARDLLDARVGSVQ